MCRVLLASSLGLYQAPVVRSRSSPIIRCHSIDLGAESILVLLRDDKIVLALRVTHVTDLEITIKNNT